MKEKKNSLLLYIPAREVPVKRPNLWIKGDEEEFQAKVIHNILNKIIAQIFENFKKKMLIQDPKQTLTK
jgi:hypothetical protein